MVSIEINFEECFSRCFCLVFVAFVFGHVLFPNYGSIMALLPITMCDALTSCSTLVVMIVVVYLLLIYCVYVLTF